MSNNKSIITDTANLVISALVKAINVTYKADGFMSLKGIQFQADSQFLVYSLSNPSDLCLDKWIKFISDKAEYTTFEQDGVKVHSAVIALSKFNPDGVKEQSSFLVSIAPKGQRYTDKDDRKQYTEKHKIKLHIFNTNSLTRLYCFI